LSLFFSCDPPPLLLPSFPTRRSSDLFVGGVQGRLNNQFAVTIAIAMLISAFNALTLSPALAALLLRPRQSSRGLLARFYGGFNHLFSVATTEYVNWSQGLIRKAIVAILI